MTELIIDIIAGKIVDRKAIKNVFANIKDGAYLLTLKSRRKRSLSQNGYYWAVVVPMVRKGLYDAGYNEITEDDEAHEVLKHLLLKKQVIRAGTDETIDITRTTASLSTEDFGIYLEKIWQWSYEYLSVYIPRPNEPLVMLAEYDENLKTTIISKDQQ